MLAWQVGDLTVICDSETSCHMSHSATGIINYCESNACMWTASGTRYPIEGYGDLPLTFRSSSGNVPLLLGNVAHVSRLNYRLLSLRAVADNGHAYSGTHEGVTVFFSTGDTLFSRLLEDLTSCTHIAPTSLLTRPSMQLLCLGLRPATVHPRC